MTAKPDYFERIRAHASQLWDQLEADPELAGPWHQLFKQVQSPRHVLSELLQNADDAGATEATVNIENQEFFFSHNGEDFLEDHFASLCRFGYSNKRALHTIGFRGIGFKSTFSIGDEVRLATPTLSVAFRRGHFSEPVWMDCEAAPAARTEIRVQIKDEYRQRDLDSCLGEWIQSPASLLFFRNLRRLHIGDQEVHWYRSGPGPVDDSDWMVLSTAPEKKHLLLRSPEERFPDDALQEIIQERMISIGEDSNFPPCRVEIVLGIESYLYVVLQTGVKTHLPFACNAPFIQDPARIKIKPVETSPTNRWLLKRVGKLAASAMLGWLNRSDQGAEDRCEAYELFPDVDRSNQSLESRCGTIVEEAFEAAIENERFLLSEKERLEPSGGCVGAPPALLNIWPAEQVASYFVAGNRSILSRYISQKSQQKFIHWECVGEMQKAGIVETLESKGLPQPESWHQLLLLWVYVSNDVTNSFRKHPGVQIVPVQGTGRLYAANEVVRLGEKKLLQSDDDWEFFSKDLRVLNQNWPRYLADQRRKAEELSDEQLGNDIATAYEVMKALNLSTTSDVSLAVDQVAKAFFANTDCNRADCTRLAHLAAALGASVSSDFKFITQSGRLRPAKETILADIDGDLDSFVAGDWYQDHVLHDGYSKSFESCTATEWREWLTSDRSQVFGFVPLVKNSLKFWSKVNLRRTLISRGYREQLNDQYASEEYCLDDWEFDKAQWDHWQRAANEDDSFWSQVLRKILAQPMSYWTRALTATALQMGTRGKAKGTRALLANDVPAGWISKLHGLPCLQDTWGAFRLPAELLRRTPETETLLDVEPFVRGELDTERNRPLLNALGVRSTPTGPERLLDRLLALAGIPYPPLLEVSKWYHRLDQMLSKCSTEQFQTIKDAFQKNSVILTETNGWAATASVFINRDEEDVPGVAVIHPSFRQLSLWHKIGVAERPTADLVITWLKNFSQQQTLCEDELRRVRSLLPLYAERIWNECKHWLNLEGKWVPVDSLAYSMSMQSLVPWKHLFPAIKEKTADFQKLSAEICGLYPFSDLPGLGDSLNDELQENPRLVGALQDKPWLTSFGTALRRVILGGDQETTRVREIANRLAETRWQIATGLETVPYIAGTPAGMSRHADVLWKDRRLYVEDRSSPKMAKAVAQEIGRVFGRQEIIDAIKICYDRSPEFINEYLEENFDLAPLETPESKSTQAVTSPDEDHPVDVSGHEELNLFEDTACANGVTQPEPIEVSSEKLQSGEQAPQIDGENGANESTEDPSPPEESDPTRLRPARPSPPKPSLIERFAMLKGYTKVDDNKFNHIDGGWIVRAAGESFPWEWRLASGEMRHLWLKECCLDRDTLQLESEVWELCKKFPDDHSLVLINLEGTPIELRGRELVQMYEKEEIKLYPGTYRLRKVGYEQELLELKVS